MIEEDFEESEFEDDGDPDLGDQSFEDFMESWDGEFPDEN